MAVFADYVGIYEDLGNAYRSQNAETINTYGQTVINPLRQDYYLQATNNTQNFQDAKADVNWDHYVWTGGHSSWQPSQGQSDLDIEWAKPSTQAAYKTKADYGKWHYENYGKNEGREVPFNGLDTVLWNKSQYVARHAQLYNNGSVPEVYQKPDGTVVGVTGIDGWGQQHWENSGKNEARILPGPKFSLDSSGNISLATYTNIGSPIGKGLQQNYNDILSAFKQSTGGNYKGLMEGLDEALTKEAFADLASSGDLNTLSGYYVGAKVDAWDPDKQGAQPPMGDFDPQYYSLQTESGKKASQEWSDAATSVNVGGYIFPDVDITERYTADTYLQWHYTTQGKPAGERGNKIENAFAVSEYQEYLTDAERQIYRDSVLGIAPTFKTINEWAAAQDPDVLSRWYDSLPTDQKQKYDAGTLEVPTLDYIPESLRSEVVMTKGTTYLEGELSNVITAKDLQEQAMFGSLTQDSLKRSVDELNRLTRNQQEFDFYMGLEGFSEIVSLNEELSNSFLGDSGVGGILAWMGDPEEISNSLETQLSNITGVPSRNSTVYSWQKWFEEQLLPVYEGGTTVTDPLDPNVTYEVSPEFAKDYIDRYLRPRFDNSKSMSEFISYMDVKQEEQNIFQTQSALSKLKDLADLRAKSYLDQIYQTTNPSAGGVALVFDPAFYWNPTGNLSEDDPKYALYQKQKETVASDWEIAKQMGSSAKPEGEPYTWDQLAYMYGLDINNEEQFAKLHYQVKGYKEEYRFDPAKDVITLKDAQDYIKTSIIPEVEAEKVELGDTTFLNFVTPEEFADAMLEGISPEENKEEWNKLLESIGLSEEDFGVEEVRQYIIEALSTGEALEIREAIKYLNEKKTRPTQEELGVNYIEREEDYQPTDSPTDTQLYKIFQDAGYQGTEDDFYRDFMPDVNRSEMELLTQGEKGLSTSNIYSGLSSKDPFEAMYALETLFADEEDKTTTSKTSTTDKKPSYFTLYPEDDEDQKQQDDIFGEFTSLFKGL